MADKAHQEGNAFYRSGDLDSAEKAYEKAVKLDRTEPKYSSNLSAVYFEQGRYLLCITAILDSWKALEGRSKLTGPTLLQQPLAIRLANRLFRCKLNAVALGQINLHSDRLGNVETVEVGLIAVVESFVKTDAAIGHELKGLWDMWTQVEASCRTHSLDQCQLRASDAQKRLREMPIFKQKLLPLLEFYRFGHDAFHSFLNGLDQDVRSNTALDEEAFLKEKFQTVSFLFGGSGDGRHAFSTLAHYGWQLKNLTRLTRDLDFEVPKLHLTMLDIHPAAVARVMVVFALMYKTTRTDLSKTLRLELEATAYFAWGCYLMPDYCASQLIAVSQELVAELSGQAPRILTKLWSVDQRSVDRIMPVLKHWSSPIPKTTEQFLKANGYDQVLLANSTPWLNSQSPSNLPFPLSMMGSPAGSGLNHLLNPAFSEEMQEGPRSLAEDQRISKDRRLVISDGIKRGYVDGRKDSQHPLYNNYEEEDNLYQTTRITLPPKELLDRHPRLEAFVKTGGRTSKKLLLDEVKSHWVPNATLFDNDSTEHPIFNSHPSGCAFVAHDSPVKVFIDMIEHALLYTFDLTDGTRGGKFNLSQTSFYIFQRYLTGVRNALVFLGGECGTKKRGGNKVALEFVCAELYSGLPQLLEGDLGPRPKGSPKKFLRMWLSNTPDYTGSFMSNAVYLSPYLDQSSLAFMGWNCLSNTPMFLNHKTMCYNYTYLTGGDFRRFFNVQVHDESRQSGEDLFLLPIPRNSRRRSSALVSKKELLEYLHLLFLRVYVCPRSGPPPFRIDEPTNLVAFVNLLVYLCRPDTSGPAYPSHWIGDFVQSLVDDKLLSDAAPYTGTLPIKPGQAPKRLSAPRHVNVAPWMMELENILVPARDGLPFHIALPASFAQDHNDIRTYSAKIVSKLFGYGQVNPCVHTVLFVFYKSSTFTLGASDESNFLLRLVDKSSSKDVQILSSQEAVNIDTNFVSWKMSRAWCNKMVEEKWSMVVYMSNERKIVSFPTEAAKWRDCSDQLLIE